MAESKLRQRRFHGFGNTGDRMMRELGRTLVAFAVAVGIMPMMASSSREALPVSEGQPLVERFFDGEAFYTGDWGNDISLLLPFKWNCGTDGLFTLFSEAEHVGTREAHWPTYQIVDGRLLYRAHEWKQENSVDFWPSELYELQFTEGKSMLVYHNEQTCRVTCHTGDVIRIFTSSIWYELNIGTNGLPHKTVHGGWPEGIFADKTIKSVRSVVPHRFRGPKANPVKEKDRIQTRQDEAVVTQSYWNMDDQKKGVLIDMHRRHVAMAFPTNTVSVVYLIACDVNNDRICDAYMSSDVEKVGTGKFMWSLYLGDEHGYSRQKASVKFSVNRTEDIYFETDVVADKNDFFRIDRVNVPAYVMVLTELEGHPESWSYFHHDNFVRKFRKEKDMSNADYYGCLDNCPEFGTPGISSIRDMFFSSYYGFALVNAERLDCIEVKVK